MILYSTYCEWNSYARFREFDFGNEEENMDEYGSPEPPEYRLDITFLSERALYEANINKM